MRKYTTKTFSLLSLMFLFGAFGFTFGQSIGLKTYIVADKTATCDAGAGKRQCLLVSEDGSDKWEYFYDNIKGFKFKENYTQKIRVVVTERRNPPSDASKFEYRLTKTINSRRTNGESARQALASLEPKTSLTLGGTTWKLAEMDGNKPGFDRGTIVFNESNNTYSAEVCNIMNGNYALFSGDRITFSPNMETKKACEQVYVLMEATFKQALGRVERYDFKDGHLNMYAGDKAVLKFRPEGGTATVNVNKSLENTKWGLMDLNGIAIKPGSDIPTVYFESKTNTVSGFAGCNNFSGKYNLAGNNIKFGELAMTKKACFDNHLNSIEMVLSNIMQKNVRYEIQGSYLYFYDGSQVVAKFMSMER